MKLKLTLAEAKILVLRALNLPSDTELVFTKVPSKMPEVKRLIEDIEDLEYRTSGKIAAIKRFRETVPCGLAEAKWAVENWNTVKTFMLNKKRLPNFSGDHYGGTLTVV